MNYLTEVKKPGKRDIPITINGIETKVRWNVYKWGEENCYNEYRIKIRDINEFKVKGSWDNENKRFKVFDKIERKIDQYYKSIDEATWRWFPSDVYKDKDASSISLYFDVFDGNFAFAKKIIKEYLNCFK
jgi:hypothetical protein